MDPKTRIRQWTFTDSPPRMIKLRCRMCREMNIPWPEDLLGCPPEICHECRGDDLGICQRESKTPFTRRTK